jgi:hypothetical protein
VSTVRTPHLLVLTPGHVPVTAGLEMTAAQSTSSSKLAVALDHTRRKSSRTEGKRVDYNESNVAAPKCAALSNSLMLYGRVTVARVTFNAWKGCHSSAEQAGCAGVTEMRMRQAQGELRARRHNGWRRRNKTL